jgi:GntR family transcriptional regulator
LPAIFTIDPRSGVPLYHQLIEQVKRAVALGTLGPGEQLPTVKALALDLTINPNTVARAYRELERDEVIETSPGRGSFVRDNGSSVEAGRAVADIASSAVDAAVREAKSLGLGRDALVATFENVLERWYPAAHPGRNT